jgi:peptidoglycan-N-acetylglucosamine deacetylase
VTGSSNAPGPVLAVNVDVDAIRFYRAIWGLPPASADAADPVWDLGVPRFLELFKELSLRATFFVVASDLVSEDQGGMVSARQVARRLGMIEEMLARGHEVASHSFSHDYALSRLPEEQITADLERASDLLADATGRPPRGFRAPGYNLSPALIGAVQSCGAIYSSSRFPSAPYFAAKWAAMLKGTLTGHRSASIVGEIRAPFTSRRPYRHANGLLELPMSVIGPLRLPAIGTFFTLYGAGGMRRLLPSLAREPWLNIELHGIDLVDPLDEGVPRELRARQPDLRTTLDRKREIFRGWLSALSEGRPNRTLEEEALRSGQER